MKPAPAGREATRLRCNPGKTRHTLPAALAAAAFAALTAATPFLRAPAELAAAPAAAASRTNQASKAVPARLELRPLGPSAETLAGVVARRYRIAVASAREVVETASR